MTLYTKQDHLKSQQEPEHTSLNINHPWTNCFNFSHNFKNRAMDYLHTWFINL